MRLDYGNAQKTSLRQTFNSAIDALSADEKRKYVTLTLIGALSGLLDFIGVVIFGIIGTLAVRGIQSVKPSPRINRILDILNLENTDFRVTLLVLTLIGALFLIVKSFISIYIIRKQIFFLNRLSSNISNRIISDIFRGGLERVKEVAPQDLRFVAQNGSRALANGILASGATLIADVFLLFLMVTILFITSPLVATLSLFLFGLFGIILHSKQEHTAFVLGKKSAENSRELDKRLTELMYGFRVVHVRGDLNKRVGRIRSINDDLAQLNSRASFMPSIGKYLMETFFIVCAVSIAILQFTLFDAAKSIGVIAIFFVSGSRIAPAILRVQQNILNFKSSSGTVEVTLSFLAKTSDQKSGYEFEAKVTPRQRDFASPFVPSVKVENLTYSYKGTAIPVLKNLSMEIEAGSKVAIVGMSGSGKSTLVDLLLGLHLPDEGQVKISGISPREAILQFPGKISYLPQETFLLQASLKQNILFGTDETADSDGYIWRLIRDVKLESRFRGHGGLELELGDGQASLSGGERQRVGLARALYSEPQLLVLDEATSALDATTESELMRTIFDRAQDMTLILIAHRLSSIKEVDRIFLVEDGSIVASGTFDQLYRTQLTFRNQVDLFQINDL